MQLPGRRQSIYTPKEFNPYELLVDSSVGLEACADVICGYVNSLRK